MTKLFFQNCHYHYVNVKCFRNLDFGEMDTECSTKKIMYFEHCEEYLRSRSNETLLWQYFESKSPFSYHLQIDKIIDVREDPGRKTDSNFDFSQAI